MNIVALQTDLCSIQEQLFSLVEHFYVSLLVREATVDNSHRIEDNEEEEELQPSLVVSGPSPVVVSYRLSQNTHSVFLPFTIGFLTDLYFVVTIGILTNLYIVTIPTYTLLL